MRGGNFHEESQFKISTLAESRPGILRSGWSRAEFFSSDPLFELLLFCGSEVFERFAVFFPEKPRTEADSRQKSFKIIQHSPFFQSHFSHNLHYITIRQIVCLKLSHGLVLYKIHIPKVVPIVCFGLSWYVFVI